MKIRIAVIAAVISLGVQAGGPSANAQAANGKTQPEPTYSEAYQSCMKRSGQTAPAIRACQNDEFGRQDSTLNAVYKKLSVKLEAERKSSLLKAERAWVQFRDAECDYEMSADAGASLGPQIFQNCKMRLTYYRVQELSRLLDLESF